MNVFPFHILQEHAPKPLLGQPCNNCGLCCRVSACEVSKNILHSEQTPCIALEVHDGKFLCGVALRPSHYIPELSQMGHDQGQLRMLVAAILGLGLGCGMDDEVTLVRIEEEP